MTKISAKIVADSKNEFGNRITTMEVIFPRFILAELNTHRMMSRNSASSRAIPFEKMLDAVENNPFIPIAWQKDHKGMQGTEYITNIEHLKVIEQDWLEARDNAIKYAKRLADGFPNNMEDDKDTYQDCVTKQLCNRLLEPFMYHKVLVTATEWENFFALRCPKYSLFYEQIPMEFRSKKDLISFTKKVESEEFKSSYDNLTELDWLKTNKGQAEIHMMELAEQMWDAMNESEPKELKAGEWHIPFGDNININKVLEIPNKLIVGEIVDHTINELNQIASIKIATARCARVSYTVVGEEDKPANYDNDIKLHDRLAKSGHMSPFEHCAQAMNEEERNNNRLISWNEQKDGLEIELGISGNFKGFIQYRKTLVGENITK